MTELLGLSLLWNVLNTVVIYVVASKAHLPNRGKPNAIQERSAELCLFEKLVVDNEPSADTYDGYEIPLPSDPANKYRKRKIAMTMDRNGLVSVSFDGNDFTFSEAEQPGALRVYELAAAKSKASCLLLLANEGSLNA